MMRRVTFIGALVTIAAGALMPADPAGATACTVDTTSAVHYATSFGPEESFVTITVKELLCEELLVAIDRNKADNPVGSMRPQTYQVSGPVVKVLRPGTYRVTGPGLDCRSQLDLNTRVKGQLPPKHLITMTEDAAWNAPSWATSADGSEPWAVNREECQTPPKPKPEPPAPPVLKPTFSLNKGTCTNRQPVGMVTLPWQGSYGYSTSQSHGMPWLGREVPAGTYRFQVGGPVKPGRNIKVTLRATSLDDMTPQYAQTFEFAVPTSCDKPKPQPMVTKNYQVDYLQWSCKWAGKKIAQVDDDRKFYFRELEWVWNTTAGAHCVRGGHQLVTVTLPKGSSPEVWIRAINAKTPAKVGDVKTTKLMSNNVAARGSVTQAWELPGCATAKATWCQKSGDKRGANLPPQIIFARS